MSYPSSSPFSVADSEVYELSRTKMGGGGVGIPLVFCPFNGGAYAPSVAAVLLEVCDIRDGGDCSTYRPCISVVPPCPPKKYPDSFSGS